MNFYIWTLIFNIVYCLLTQQLNWWDVLVLLSTDRTSWMNFNLHCYSFHRAGLVTRFNVEDLQPPIRVNAIIDYSWSTVYQVGWYYLFWGEVRTYYMIAVITDCECLNPLLPISLINSRPTTQSELLDPLSLSGFQWFHMVLISVLGYKNNDHRLSQGYLIASSSCNLAVWDDCPFKFYTCPPYFWIIFFCNNSAGMSGQSLNFITSITKKS